jgi:hypothetical protein
VTEYVRLITRTDGGLVHIDDGGGEPACETRRGRADRYYKPVDESVYPRAHWDKCSRCFGEHELGKALVSDGGER